MTQAAGMQINTDISLGILTKRTRKVNVIRSRKSLNQLVYGEKQIVLHRKQEHWGRFCSASLGQCLMKENMQAFKLDREQCSSVTLSPQ